MAQDQIRLQKQIRDNAIEVSNYVSDLNNWSTDVMAEELAEILPDEDSNMQSNDIPIRGSVQSNKKLENDENNANSKDNPQKKVKRIVGSDYSAWEKFDVEEACKEVDMSDDPRADPPLEEEDIVRRKALELRNKALVTRKKELGNKCIQEKDYQMAVRYYTEAINLDAKSAILPANRAQAYLYMNEYRKAIFDCDAAITNDSTYVKAYFRRAKAKIELGDHLGAQVDLKKTLTLDPQNKEARTMLGNLEKSKRQGLTAQRGVNNVNRQFTNFNNKSQSDLKPSVIYPRVVHPIDKPPHLQSKRSLFSVYVKIKGEEKENKIRRMDSSSSSTWNYNNSNGSLSSGNSFDTTPTTSQINSPLTPDLELNLSDSFETMRVGSITIPEKPKTGVEFTLHWKQLKPYSTSAAQYLLQMKADDYLIFEDTMESSVLSDILDTLVWEFLPRNWDITEHLEGLTKVRRLKTLILFLTEKDRANARKLISLCPRKELQDFYLTNYNF